jgi:TonB family protein
MRHSSIHLHAIRLVALVGLFGAFSAPASAQESEISQLASELASTLHQSKWALTGEQKVVVVAFQGPKGETSQLGVVLANIFVIALLREAGNLKVVERSEFPRYRQTEPGPKIELWDPYVARTLAKEAGASLFITGSYGKGADRISLAVKATRLPDEKVIGEARSKIPIPGELRKLFALPPTSIPTETGTETSAVKTTTQTETVFLPGENGVGYPECARCPDPSFTQEARVAKYSARVRLRIVITPQGNVGDIRVVEPAKYGLTEQAIQAVRTWKFKAARDREGKPVPVEVLIEVTFRLK